MSNFKDILGNKISVGDIISVGDYSYTISIAKVYKITDKSVCFKSFLGKIDPVTRLRNPLTSKDLVEEPSGWRGWCSVNTKRRLLVLKKTNIVNNLKIII